MSGTWVLWRERLSGNPRVLGWAEAVGTFLLGLLCLAVGLVGLWSDVPAPWEGGSRWWFLLTLVAGSALLVPARSHPMRALGAGIVVFGVDVALGGSIGVLLVLFNLIYVAALHAGPRSARFLTTGVIALVPISAVVGWVATRDAQSTVALMLQTVALPGTPVWWGTAVRRQTELTALATRRAEDLHRLADLREADILREERARMARDLHDAIAGNVSAIAIHAEAALSAPADASRDRRALEAIRPVSVTALEEMRSMILLLRSGNDAPAAPARLCDADALLTAARASGNEVVWHGPPAGTLEDLPAAVDQAAYRILQEALTNAVRHTPGAPVQVRVDVGALDLRVRVTSAAAHGATGVPAADEGGTRLGLLTMRERAEALGGRLSAGWRDEDAGRCWVVDATLPRAVPR